MRVPVRRDGATATIRWSRISLGRVLQSESSDYFLLLGVTLFLTVWGLIMVLSSSSVVSNVDGTGFFGKFWKQGSYALIGLPLMLLVSRVPTQFWKRWVWVLLTVTCALQVLVIATPLGVKINGNRNWLQLGSLPAVQPSEAIKVAVVVWLGVFLTKKDDNLRQWRKSLVPALLVTGAATALVTIGGDLGTTMILGGMILGALFFAGTPIRHLAITATLGSLVAILIAVSRPNRVIRILAFLQPAGADPTSEGWQILNGDYALASGGVFGVGLGNSHAKWAWLPAADTDFIFAIIGEELGLIGAMLVLVLFAMLAIMFLRIIRASTDTFARVTTAAIMTWIIGEAFVNIAVVLGFLPVLGVPFAADLLRWYRADQLTGGHWHRSLDCPRERTIVEDSDCHIFIVNVITKNVTDATKTPLTAVMRSVRCLRNMGERVRSDCAPVSHHG